MDKEITLKQLQKTVDSWIKDKGVRYFNELTNMVILTEEVGELAKGNSQKIRGTVIQTNR